MGKESVQSFTRFVILGVPEVLRGSILNQTPNWNRDLARSEDKKLRTNLRLRNVQTAP